MKIIYDRVFIGAGIIFILESIFQKSKKQKILIIEKKNCIGGAWKPLNLFGFNNVENAIHYLLPNPEAINFLVKVLHLKVIASDETYVFLKKSFFGISVIKYNNTFSNFFRDLDKKKVSYYNLFFISFLFFKNLFIKKNRSYYFKFGAPALYKKILFLAKHYKLSINFNTVIKNILINKNKIIEIKTNKDVIYTKKILISHGTNIFSTKGIFKNINIKKKKVRRPSLHILIFDKKKTLFEKSIFNDHNIIKYIHDVTKYTEKKNKKNTKIFVIALKPFVKNNYKNYLKVFYVMKKIGIIGKDSKILRTYWQEIYLPDINDNDLDKISNLYKNHIECFKTDNFTESIFRNIQRWEKFLFKSKYNLNLKK